MTTPRDEATALLAEALHNPSSCNLETHSAARHADEVEWALAASPTLAAAIEFGLAWARVERALPEGYTFDVTYMAGRPVVAEAWHMGHSLASKVAECHGPTPTAALDQLARNLEGVE